MNQKRIEEPAVSSLEELYDRLASTPSPMSRSCPGIEADKKVIRQGWLTQAMIDAPAPPVLSTWKDWLRADPKGWSTILLIIVFAAGLWACFAIWGGCEVLKAVNTASKG